MNGKNGKTPVFIFEVEEERGGSSRQTEWKDVCLVGTDLYRMQSVEEETLKVYL